MAAGRPVSCDLAYDALVTVRVGRSAADRIGGRLSLVLEQCSGLPIAIAGVSQLGIVAELAERLANVAAR
jgi:hypothetical protein